MNGGMMQRTYPILITVIAALTGGALAGNVIAGDVLGLSETWRTALWIVGAIVGTAVAWSSRAEATTLPSRTRVVGTATVLLIAVSLVVLLHAPASYLAAGAVLAAGGVVLLSVERNQEQ